MSNIHLCGLLNKSSTCRNTCNLDILRWDTLWWNMISLTSFHQKYQTHPLPGTCHQAIRLPAMAGDPFFGDFWIRRNKSVCFPSFWTGWLLGSAAFEGTLECIWLEHLKAGHDFEDSLWRLFQSTNATAEAHMLQRPLSCQAVHHWPKTSTPQPILGTFMVSMLWGRNRFMSIYPHRSYGHRQSQ